MNKKEFLIISVTVFLTSLAWLLADIYRASTEEKIKGNVQAPQIKNYQIREDVLKILETKKSQ